MLQADSAHQIGPETSLQSVLIVVESGGTGEELPRLCTSALRNSDAVPHQNALPYHHIVQHYYGIQYMYQGGMHTLIQFN